MRRKRYTAKDIGDIVRTERKRQGVTQTTLAMVSNTGHRFISDLENGKPTCQLDKSLAVLYALGVEIKFDQPKG